MSLKPSLKLSQCHNSIRRTTRVIHYEFPFGLGIIAGSKKMHIFKKTFCDWFAHILGIFIMTSSNGNTFRVTGPLCGEITGPGEFPTQRPVTRSFDDFFDLRLNKPLSKQSWGWWFETLSRSLWRHRNISLGHHGRINDQHRRYYFIMLSPVLSATNLFNLIRKYKWCFHVNVTVW